MRRAGPRRGRAAADRRRRGGRRHRPGRAVVLHHLRRLRRAVPGRHRARRPHRRHAPLPGADRVELPVRGRRDAAQPGEQGQPVGRAAEHPGGLDQGPGLRGAPGRRRSTTSSTCSGSAAPARSRTGRRRPPGRSPSCCTRPGVSFAILGEGETCTGDPARRIGNEFLFQMLAQQNVETLNEAFGDADGQGRSSRPARTASTPSATSTAQLGGDFEVVHHTQLLAHLVGDRQADPGRSRSTAASPTTTRATWAGTTGSSRRRASCSARRRRRDAADRDAAQRGALVLLRRRRRADVDGGADRQADQRRAGRGGPRHRREDDRGRLPVLPRPCSPTGSPARRPPARAEDVEVVDVATVLLRSVSR